VDLARAVPATPPGPAGGVAGAEVRVAVKLAPSLPIAEGAARG
jgi:hypothetical protein